MTAIVGPLPAIRFRDGTVVAYRPPRDTCDGERWKNCTDHRPACDCREAEMAEQIGELRAELTAARDAARRILAGHPTFVYEAAPDGTQREVGCMCTGCRIARDAYLLRSYENDSHTRDEVYGLDADALTDGVRWKVCTPSMRTESPCVCQWGLTRPRGVYHEHMTYEGTPIRPPQDDDEVPF